MYGGASLYCYSCGSLSFDKPSYNNAYAYKGGAIFLDYDSSKIPSVSINISDFSIAGFQTYSDGGLLYLVGTSQNVSLTFSANNFTQIKSNVVSSFSISDQYSFKGNSGGGLLYINAGTLEAVIENCIIGTVYS